MREAWGTSAGRTAPARYWARASRRRTARGAALLVVLIALGLGGVMAAAAGARRTSSADERLLAVSNPADMFLFAATPEVFDEIAARDDIAHATGMIQLGLQPAGVGCSNDDSSYFQVLVPAAGEPFGTPKPQLVHGRFADPAAPNEAVVSEQHARRLGVEVGDRIEYLAHEIDGDEIVGCEDHVASVEVVGIIRELFEIGADAPTLAATYLTPAFVDAHPDAPVVTHAGIGGFAQLVEGTDRDDALADINETAPRQDGEPLAGAFAITGLAPFSPALDALAVGLWALAAVLAAATVVTLAVTISRQAGAAASDLRTLSAFGATRAQLALAASLPALVAVALGIPLAVLMAVVLSAIHLVGIATKVEPDPGIAVDGAVVVGGAAIAVLYLGVLIAAIGARAAHRTVHPGDASPERRTVANMLLRRGAPPWAAMGASYALDRSRRDALPTRGAGVALAAATTGLLAVLVFGLAVGRANNDPAIYGWGSWDALATTADAVEPGTIDVVALLMDDPAVSAVAEVTIRFKLELDGVVTGGMTVDHRRGDAGPTVVSGRLPRGPDEIALGSATAEELHRPIGSQVATAGPSAGNELRVVGIVAFLGYDGDSIRHGWIAERDAIDALGWEPGCNDESECFHTTAISWVSDVDVDAATARLAAAAIELEPAAPSREVDLISEADQVPGIAAVGVSVIAIVGVAHALVATVSRRRHELAIARALGFRPRDAAGAIGAEAATIAAVSAIAGAVLGAAAGRVAWDAAAREIGIGPGLPSIAWLVTAVALGTLVLPLVVSILPAIRAARSSPGLVLRDE